MSVYKNKGSGLGLDLIAGGTLYADVPVGTIIPFGGSVIPRGYLLCNGQAVSRADYTELFAVIGTVFGVGDDTTTFNIPDLRETLPVGAGENTTFTITAHDVYALGEFKDDQLQGHDHYLYSGGNNKYANYWNNGGVNDNRSQSQFNSTRPGSVYTKEYKADGVNGTPRTGTTTHGKQTGVNYIIKAKQVAVPSDFMNAVVETNSYSTDETVVGKWIDGKPIYRKVIVSTFGLSSGSRKTLTLSNFGVNNVETPISSTIISNDGGYLGIRDINVLTAFKATTVDIALTSGYSLNSGEQKIILEYTKTTDA